VRVVNIPIGRLAQEVELALLVILIALWVERGTIAAGRGSRNGRRRWAWCLTRSARDGPVGVAVGMPEGASTPHAQRLVHIVPKGQLEGGRQVGLM
jgi:hypothetical protein